MYINMSIKTCENSCVVISETLEETFQTPAARWIMGIVVPSGVFFEFDPY